ncbi:pyridoxal-dependent decarboxylase [Defluviimonas sp. D31]|uniref:pyridoxal phosphate-dependent decarboxylase family protein n=1 Tax=Defluviimonas sp. D31 TaxID=3083253 RepID=UPI00296E5355|nr:pyridoxal-dependent decarboxylase [Defluviimonas sp. D31]MDW4548237.1 pyridoxal-dependent decarboxylase [Defluviimonas sp. D31]
MRSEVIMAAEASALRRAADYGAAFRDKGHPLHPAEGAPALRRRFCCPLGENGRDGAAVIEDLIAAAEPGLVGNTDGAFFAWVMGGSNLTGVAADWLASVWGQNAATYQCSPAAAVAEEAVEGWILDLLDLPRESSVGFVTGATMAGFVGLAAARGAVLRRVGHDIDRLGLQGAPLVRIYLSDEAHVSNHTALKFLGFGEANLERIGSERQGVMRVPELAEAMARHEGPKIVIGQAGQINTGGFDDFEALADLAEAHDAWLHVDGAFGLWLRVLPEKAALTAAIERADSWSVDGHKWLQVPYDSGFAIVRDREAHRRAMDMTAAYIAPAPDDGRDPKDYNPELSRRARGFATWAVLQGLGRSGVRDLVRRHCALATALAERLSGVAGLRILNRVDCNQVVFACDGGPDPDTATRHLVERLNATGKVFLRTTDWKGRAVIRVSVIAEPTGRDEIDRLGDLIEAEWARLRRELAEVAR